MGLHKLKLCTNIYQLTNTAQRFKITITEP